ncbi:M6 family metalloprotease domain-containing protein [Actinomadura kijaniata]|uniref:M6 family metalloprotease domain-containing protein n=1 Tax=Actinomadura kijaniata TaxID=46161 RepID=UPI003F19F5A5
MRRAKRFLVPAAALLLAGLAAGPAAAAPKPQIPDPTPNPWQMRHWPQTQPWQQGQKVRSLAAPGRPRPVDPQNYELPDTMTWDDYKPIPGTKWADPSVKGSVRNFKGAVILVDYPNQPFVVTQKKNSTVFGNPSLVGDVPREKVAQFYQDFLNKPQALNHGHTLHEYWMEDSGGRYGVDLKAFGAYRMSAKDHEYGIDSFQGGTGCPQGDTCGRDIRKDARAAWIAEVGEETAKQFDFVFILTAGQDESSTWQEFGMMKWKTKEEVPDEWGPENDATLPNWVKTRYVDWTSWQAGSSHWPNAVTGSSTQAESSGMAVFAHEFSHILGIGDNYNNPFGNPPRRAYSGPWEMLSRGSFNGPGGPHSRWMIPATGGASMGAQHMLRNKLKLGIVDPNHVLQLNSDVLASSGVVVAKVTARAADPGRKGLAGINLKLTGGDKSPKCDWRQDPLCDGGGYDNYTVEVVDRMGFDSFTPDSGVLLAKTKDKDEAPFIWVKDAHPEDIDKPDFVYPDGTVSKMTIGDYRQLSDALYHAGADSGSQYEYVDKDNRLHFYVLNLKRDRKGVLSYTVAVRSLDGSGPYRRGVKVGSGVQRAASQGWSKCVLTLRNTGKGGTGYNASDVYRLKATVAGSGWKTWLPHEIATAKAGGGTRVEVWAKRSAGADRHGRVTLRATSESDPTRTDTGTCHVR